MRDGRIDWVAVAGGAATMALGTVGVLFVGLPWQVVLVVAGLSGAVGGVLSRNFEDEFVDGGIGTLVGALAAPLLLAAYVALPVGGPGLPNLAYYLYAVGMFAAVFLAPIPAVLGAVTAAVAASWHRQLRAELGA